MTRLSLARSGRRIRGSVDIVYDAFPTVCVKESHQLLVLSENLLHNFCSYCCNWRCWIFRGGRCLPYSYGVEIWWRGGLQFLP